MKPEYREEEKIGKRLESLRASALNGKRLHSPSGHCGCFPLSDCVSRVRIVDIAENSQVIEWVADHSRLRQRAVSR